MARKTAKVCALPFECWIDEKTGEEKKQQKPAWCVSAKRDGIYRRLFLLCFSGSKFQIPHFQVASQVFVYSYFLQALKFD